MIVVKVEIICDVCGKIFETVAEMDYRISSAASNAITAARSNNWQFIRNAGWKLQHVYCPACAFHVTKMDGD